MLNLLDRFSKNTHATQIPHKTAWYQTVVPAFRGWQLTASSLAPLRATTNDGNLVLAVLNLPIFYYR